MTKDFDFWLSFVLFTIELLFLAKTAKLGGLVLIPSVRRQCLCIAHVLRTPLFKWLVFSLKQFLTEMEARTPQLDRITVEKDRLVAWDSEDALNGEFANQG